MNSEPKQNPEPGHKSKPRTHFTVINKNAGEYSPAELGKLYDILHGQPQRLTGEIIATPDLSSLEYHLRRYQEFHPDILGIGGGDGTASQTLTLVQKVWGEIPPYIASYALGTMNNLAIPLGLSDGLVDKLKQRTGIGDTKALQLARYIRESAENETEMNTQNISLLSMNGRYGFNLGMGLVPKLIWLYYGKSIDQYRQLEEELAVAAPSEYEKILAGILTERKSGEGLIDIIAPQELLRGLGVINALKTMSTSISGIVLRKKKEHDFFAEGMEAELYAVDNEGMERKLELPRPPTGIYIASYEDSTLGLPKVHITPAPEAREKKGKMQVVITYANPLEVVMQIPALFGGRHLEKTEYIHTSQLRVVGKKPIIAEVDADTVIAPELVVRYEKELKFIRL